MREDELEAVIRLWHETSEATYGFLETERGRTFEDRRGFFLRTIAVENELWVCEDRQALAGFLALQGDFIDRLYVRPTLQRSGVGTALLNKAKELSPERLRLFTHQENGPARAFYEKEGFVATAFGVSPPPESAPDVEYLWEPAQSSCE